jgi:hypothetical protein
LLAHGSIQSIYSMRNPDKLKRLSEDTIHQVSTSKM